MTRLLEFMVALRHALTTGYYRLRLSRIGHNSVIRGRITVAGGRRRNHLGISVGDDSVIYEGCRLTTDTFLPTSGITIGDRCAFNHDCYIGGSGGVRIGDAVLLGPGVCILSAGHSFAPDVLTREQPLTFGPVSIESNVWIGARAIVLPGVTIGTGSVVAAGAVISRDVPPGMLARGVPATCEPIRARRATA